VYHETHARMLAHILVKNEIIARTQANVLVYHEIILRVNQVVVPKDETILVRPKAHTSQQKNSRNYLRCR